MRLNGIFLGIAVALALMPCVSVAQDEMAMLSMDAPAKPKEEPRVTAVYGVSADDYLPNIESARKRLRPKVRSSASRASLDLPDAFYFIGAPIFFFLFLRVIVIFLNGFEERRREEMGTMVREVWDTE